jgi:hypothetical protein
MGFVILLILSSTIVPAYLISLLIEKTKYGSALGFDNESGRRKIMIRTYLILSSVVLIVFFFVSGEEFFNPDSYY